MIVSEMNSAPFKVSRWTFFGESGNSCNTYSMRRSFILLQPSAYFFSRTSYRSNNIELQIKASEELARHITAKYPVRNFEVKFHFNFFPVLFKFY